MSSLQDGGPLYHTVWYLSSNSSDAACKLLYSICLLYTSDAADDLTRVDLGGRRIIKMYLFADDAKLYCHVKNHGNMEDLQTGIKKFIE